VPTADYDMHLRSTRGGAVLYISGRDIQKQEFSLSFQHATARWRLMRAPDQAVSSQSLSFHTPHFRIQ
jgi:hypothetical protein